MTQTQEQMRFRFPNELAGDELRHYMDHDTLTDVSRSLLEKCKPGKMCSLTRDEALQLACDVRLAIDIQEEQIDENGWTDHMQHQLVKLSYKLSNRIAYINVLQQIEKQHQ